MKSLRPQQGFRDQQHRRLRGFVNLLQVRFSGIVVGHPGEQQLGESENDRELIAQVVSEPWWRQRWFQWSSLPVSSLPPGAAERLCTTAHAPRSARP
jgi:hypothetical protein